MRLLHRHIILFIAFHLIFGYFPYAQEVPKVIQFKSTDYNAGHQNWMITQDCEGYIYAANTDGVLIYNGFKWRQITLPKNQKPRAVFLGKDCRVYTGAFESFGYIDHSDKSQPFYRPVGDSILQGSNQEIWNIFGNEEQVIFQSFSNIYQFDYENISQVIPPGNVMLGRMINNELYIPKIEQGLYKIERDQVVDLPAAASLPASAKLADLCNGDSQKEIILGTQYDGIFILKKNKLSAINSDLNERLKNEQINKIIRLSSGDYAIGTILNGVYITDDFLSIEYHINKSNGLANNTVLSLFEDKNKNLWVGLDKGLNLLRISEPLRYFYDRQGLLGTLYTTIQFENTLYLGSNQGLFKSNPDGSFQLIDDSQGQIWSFIVVDNDLLCGHNNGTYLIKNDSFINISAITGGWCMEAISGNRILQSTYTGLVILEKKDGKWAEASRVKDGDILIEKFALSGNTLVGYHSHYGICVVRFSDQFDEVINKKIIRKIDSKEINMTVDFLSSDQGVALLIDADLYLFENDSLIKIDPERLKEFEKDEDFVVEQKFYNSIRKISKLENISNYHYFKPDYSKENFIIGFDEGYLQAPISYADNNIVSAQHIEVDYVTVNGRVCKNTKAILFKPSENSVSIQIKDFSFLSHKIPLRYQLKNWNEQWREIPPDGQLNFINLDDGKYNLYIKEEENEPLMLLEFTIEPHWYESWQGGILYTTLALFLLLYLNKRDNRKLKQQTERLQKEKERELESERIKAKNDELERELMYKSKMLVNSTLALVQKNKMLNELKNVISRDEMGESINRQHKQRILRLINKNIDSDKDWEIFEKNFAEVHHDFLEKIKEKYPDITAGELKLAAYIRMNLSSKEIAPLLNISVRSVENKRYRLRKKMGVEHTNNLSDLLLRL